MTLWDMIGKTVYYQDVQVFTSGDVHWCLKAQ